MWLKRGVQALLARLGYRMVKIRPTASLPINVLPLVVEDWRATKARRGDDTFTVVQIGAHDGLHYDPVRPFIKRYHWKGVLVEPQPAVFAELVKNYADESQLAFEQAAIAAEDGTMRLYAFREGQGLPAHASMLTSFQREALERKPHGYEGVIDEITVPALSLRTLVARHRIASIDLLQIDAEGFDYHLVKMVSTLPSKPTIINFESGALSLDQQSELRELLHGWGYRILTIGIDTVAYRQPEDEQFAETHANAGYG